MEAENIGPSEGMHPLRPIPPIPPESEPAGQRKLRCDSIWSTLTPEQRQTVETWLCEENAGYKVVQARVLQDFGLSCSITSVAAFYRRAQARRAVAGLAPALETAAAVNAACADLESLRSSACKLIAQKLQDAAIAGHESRELTALGHLLLQHKECEIQRERLHLARERFEFKAAKEVLKALPLASQFSADDHARETARIEAIKKKLFGRELPYIIE